MPDSVSGSVYQRRDGKWCAALTVNGKRRALYADSEREAKKKLAKLQGELATNGTLPTPGRRTVDDLLTEWLDSAKPHLKPRTYGEYEAMARRHIRPAMGKVWLSKLEPAHVQRLCNRLTADGKNRQSKLIFNLLHRALGVAAKQSC